MDIDSDVAVSNTWGSFVVGVFIFRVCPDSIPNVCTRMASKP